MRRFLSVISAALTLIACGDPAVSVGKSSEAISANGLLHAAVCGPGGPGAARCHARVVIDGRGDPLATPGPAGYGPADLQAAYGIIGQGAATVAIVDANGYANAETDLAVYRSKFGLPACTTANGCFKKVDQRGGKAYPRDNTGWAQETALDLDMVSAMCPGCKILLVQADSASFGNLATAVDTAALGANVISNSYGGGETGSATWESHYNHPGVAITVSSGDSGFGVQFPASSPHVIAVGGTSLKRVLTGGFAETAWSGAGSGCSTVFDKPIWQTDPSCAKRTVADVSAVADPNTGVAVYGPSKGTRSAWMVFGGTSVAAPLIGGIYGERGVFPTSAPDLYAAPLYAAPATAFNDVTVGSNGSCGGSYLCTASVGFDGPTGLGTPAGDGAF